MTVHFLKSNNVFDLPPELAQLYELRDAMKRQIEADLERIERCLYILDSTEPDADLESDSLVYGRDGSITGLDPDLEDDGDSGIGDLDGVVEQGILLDVYPELADGDRPFVGGSGL